MNESQNNCTKISAASSSQRTQCGCMCLYIRLGPLVQVLIISLGSKTRRVSFNHRKSSITVTNHLFLCCLYLQGVIEFSLCLLFAKLVSYTFLFWLPLYITKAGEDPTQLQPSPSLPSFYFKTLGISFYTAL